MIVSRILLYICICLYTYLHLYLLNKNKHIPTFHFLLVEVPYEHKRNKIIFLKKKRIKHIQAQGG